MGYPNVAPLVPFNQSFSGTNLEETDNEGATSFLRACKNESLEYVKILCDKGANVLARNRNGDNAVHYAVLGTNLPVLEYLFQLENLKNYFEAKLHQGDNSFHLACKSNNSQIVRFLVETVKVDIFCENDEGKTGLHLACEGGSPQIVKYLVENTKLNDVNKADTSGMTPLHFICAESQNNEKRSKEIVQYLISKGANIHAKDKCGLSPLHYLDKEKNPTLCEFIGKIRSNIKSNSLEQLAAQRKVRNKPLEVTVISATEFRRPPDYDCYEMTNKPRGFALIINIRSFVNNIHEVRIGSEVDTKNLTSLFYQLGFKVTAKTDLIRRDILECVNHFRDSFENRRADMCFLAIMSHGEDGSFFCVDGSRVSEREILEKFSNLGAPKLKGKPKLFLFTHCRGDDPDAGVSTDSCNPSKSPTWEDTMILYATLPGFVANRDLVKGTWYVDCLCEAFMDFSCDYHLDDLIRIMNYYMRDMTSERGSKQSCEHHPRHFYKKLYFNPGL